MNSTVHFTLDEFAHSDLALRRGIDNRLPPELLGAAMQTLAMLERIRACLTQQAGYDVPMILTSGYRSPPLNALLGSAITSDHPRAAAADWTAPAFGTPLQVCEALAPHMAELGIGQLIHEFGRWVHTSTRAPSLPINRIITISSAGTRAGLLPV